MKYKRILAIVLVFIMVLQSAIFVSADEDDGRPEYDRLTNTFKWSTDVPMALPGVTIRYQTLGFKATLTHSSGSVYSMYFKPNLSKPPETYPKSGRTWEKSSYSNPFSGSSIGIYEIFKNKYGSNPTAMKEITEFFATANKPLILDAVIALKKNDVVQGSMNVSNGNATFSGTLYHSANEFINSGIGWSRETREQVPQTLFGIKLQFEPQPVGDPKPVIKRQGENGQRIESPTHTFKEGEPIKIDGADSWFPSKVTTHKYIWTYNKVGGTAKEVVNNNPGTPFTEPLEAGEYVVKLKVSANYERPWDKSSIDIVSSTEARTTIRILPNPEPSVTVTISSPDMVKYEENESYKNIPVTLNATVNNIDLDIIDKLYLKVYEKNLYKEQMYSARLSQSLEHNFNIFYDEDRLQEFEGYAILILKNGKEIKSNISNTDTWIYKEKERLPNEPPVAILNLPSKTIVGNSVLANGAMSYDPDGEIVRYDFNVPWLSFTQSSNDPETLGRSSAIIKFPTRATYTVKLQVWDDSGNTATDEKQIVVEPPPPVLEISASGFFKENRAVKLSVFNHTENLSPVGNDYTWEITPLDNGVSDNVIKMTTTTGRNPNVLFKEEGRYLLRVSGTNRDGVHGFTTKIIEIKEDLPPIPEINLSDITYRDDTRFATINAYSNAYSIDGDFIEKRTWYYRFDSNNDGSFESETWKKIKETTDHLDTLAFFKVNHIGKYEVKLVVQEVFGQDTIPEFITEEDYKTSEITKVIEVDNIAPSVSFDAANEKNIDIAVITDYEGQELLDVEAKLNSFVRDSYDQYLNVKFNIVSEKKYIGRYLHPEASGFRNVTNTSNQRYEVADWYTTRVQIGSDYGYDEEGYEIPISVYHNTLLKEYSDNLNKVGVYRFWNLPFNSGQENHVTETQFPARVKKSFGYGEANFWLLENGDLYFAGTGSRRSGDYASPSYVTSPTKLLSNVKQIEGSFDMDYTGRYFFLLENGDVYFFGRDYHLSTAYWLFVNFRNGVPNWRSIIPTINDPHTYQNVDTSYTGNNVVKIPGFSNIDYIWSNGGAFVARDRNGVWKGFGSGLNAFGLSTGFVNTPPKTGPSFAYNVQYPRPFVSDVYFDTVNSIVTLDNLTNLDITLGGILKVEPNKVYTRNGEVYLIQETPTLLGDDKGMRFDEERQQWEAVPLQVIHSEFTYEKIGEWSPDALSIPKASSTVWGKNWAAGAGHLFMNEIRPYDKGATTLRLAISNFNIEEIELGYQPNPYRFDDYDDYDYNGKNANFTTQITIPLDYEKSISSIWDYSVLTYNARIKGTKSKIPGTNFYRVTATPIENTQVEISTSPYQTGWKTYTVDASKIQNINYRNDAEKYVVYLGKKDSFKAVSKNLLDFIKSKNASVRVSTNSKYLDGLVSSSEINLRQFMNATPYGKLYGENKLDDILLDILKENIKEEKPGNGIYVIVNEDTVEYSKFYRDLEGDPKFSDKVFGVHDELYFENSMGKSSIHNKNVTVPSMKFDKSGKYQIKYSAIDNPSINNLFSGYRKESNEIDLTIFAHRRPIPNFEFDFDYKETSVGVAINDLSYDLDHQSKANKGIVKWEWFYKINNQVNWSTGKPTTANYGDIIEVYLKVTDIEGASASIINSIQIPKEAPLVLKAKARTLDNSFRLTSIPASEKLELYEVWTKYPNNVKLEVAMFQGTTQKTTTQTINYSTSTGKKVGRDITWNNIVHTIPDTLPDGNYTLKIKAISDDGKTGELNFPVTVNTPINLVPDMKSKLFTDDTTSIKSNTTKYADSVTVQLCVGHPFSTNISLNGTQSENLKNWIRNYTVPRTIPDGTYTARFTATTPNGNKDIKDLTFIVESLKISAMLKPNPALAGDEIIFTVDTEGYADKIVIVVPNDIISKDNRTSKGYAQINYPLTYSVDGSIDKKQNIFKYVLWHTTDQTLSKTNTQLRPPYKFIVIAYKGANTKEVELYLDVKGNVLELIKPGIKLKGN